MGGFGSGRKGGRHTVEDCLGLDINRLLRDGLFVPGRRVAGFVRWTDAGTSCR